MFTYAVWMIKSTFLLSAVFCSVTKRRGCVEYRKENYFVATGHLEEIYTATERQCMKNCMWHRPCTAFNYHAVNKLCILLPGLECMTPNPENSSGYVFVHLTTCKFQPVYTSVRPADRNWYWSTTDNLGENTGFVVLPGGLTRWVSRVLYRGYYLPGWWGEDGYGFRAVDPVSAQVVRCLVGELLAFPNDFFHQWNPYAAGNPLPECALPISQLPDGTPLYIVRHEHGNSAQRMSGFYNHVTKSTYFVVNRVISPVAVDILCWTIIWCDAVNDSPLCCCRLPPMCNFPECWIYIYIYIYILRRADSWWYKPLSMIFHAYMRSSVIYDNIAADNELMLTHC